jgi:cation:H+ antiporter
MQTTVQIIGGLILLAVGGEAVVRGAVGVARRLGVSELLIGLTLVSFGTSAPELLTSVQAALAGSPGISIGNVVGSSISNILLIFAIVALFRPVPVDPNAIRRDGLVMIAASLLLTVIGVTVGVLSRWVGVILVAGLVGYTIVAWIMERHGGAAAQLHESEGHSHDPVPSPLWLSIGIALLGFGLLVLGANFLVTGAIALAQQAGLSETVIGLTIVALGTSLPELVASLAAAVKGRTDVAFGNIVGSNIYNVLGILGVTAIITPISFPSDIVARDWIALCGSAIILVFHAWTGARVSRWEGGTLLALYGVYAALLLFANV